MPVDEIAQYHLWKLVKSESDQAFRFNYHLQEIQETKALKYTLEMKTAMSRLRKLQVNDLVS